MRYADAVTIQDAFNPVQEAAAAVRARTDLQPEIAIVLGSGLGALAAEVENAVELPYEELPHFARSTAPGHAGRLVLGYLEDRPVAVMAGRIHLYEGHEARDVVLPIRTLFTLGARQLIITNAAGGVNEHFHPGTLMLIADHINLTGRNPLIGLNDPRFGVRFPDMSDAYDAELRRHSRRVALDLRQELAEGVYLALNGPSYETPAEIRMCRMLGADAVGMSTVMEVIAARHLGMRVLGISCITNMAAGMLPQKLSEEEVIATANSVRSEFMRLVRALVATMPPTGEEEQE